MAVSLIVLVLCGIVVVALVLSVSIVAFIKLGVLFRHAAEPPHHDHGTYTLDQGREVRPEQDGEWR
ncbi:MAG TPA: hypothetical protein VFT66_02135 [Roseiflexaceae bacterium]|nr:hypothetical protein [Roseiflexaceae bacterium]